MVKKVPIETRSLNRDPLGSSVKGVESLIEGKDSLNFMSLGPLYKAC